MHDGCVSNGAKEEAQNMVLSETHGRCSAGRKAPYTVEGALEARSWGGGGGRERRPVQ